MCCFSRPIRFVANTGIFARLVGDRQAVAYAMRLGAEEDLAMVLPIPTPPRSAEDAVEFVSLKKYAKFFVDMASGFPQMEQALYTRSAGRKPKAMPKLKVHAVGAFDASFVPTQNDFDRLDERFRIAKEVWATIPIYDDYGFAVFKLRKGENQHVHPMAFWFPTRHPDQTFFPTVHIHHGEWTPIAGFDHNLYLQVPEGRDEAEDPEADWMSSTGPARRFMSIRKTRGLVRPDRHVYKRTVRGRLPNEDILV